MSWFSSISIGLLTGLWGGFGAGYLATLCVRWYRIPSFEGASSYYVIMIALLGASLGLAGGIICLRLLPGGDMGFFKGLGWTTGGTTTLLLVAGLFCRLAADPSPEIDGKSLELVVEVRTPADFALPPQFDDHGAFACVWLERGRAQSAGKLELDKAVQAEGRWVVNSTVPLDTSASQKLLRVYFNPENDVFFSLPLRAYPNSHDLAWSVWVDARANASQAGHGPEGNFAMRYRVQPIELPSIPTQAEIEPASPSAEQTMFASIPIDAPVSAWLPYTRYGMDEARRRIAVERITARPHHAQELGELMVSSDQSGAVDALRVIEYLPEPAGPIVEEVRKAGRHLVSLLNQGNAITAVDDESYLWAADVGVRFSAWMVAVRTLREKNRGDFTPELGEILVLSRVRDDSHVIRSDVRRVASHYMQQWAGLSPLATDPKP